jgi:hypothetical protein
VSVAEQRLEEAPLALPECLGERPRAPVLVNERPELEPGAQALARLRGGEPANERLGRLGREGGRLDRVDDLGDSLRLDTMYVQDAVGARECCRRDEGAKHSAVGRKPDPRPRITLRLRRRPLGGEPRGRPGADVGRAGQQRLKHRLFEPAPERAD